MFNEIYSMFNFEAEGKAWLDLSRRHWLAANQWPGANLPQLPYVIEKSRIQETKNLATDMDSSTDTKKNHA